MENEIDPVTLEVINSRLSSIPQEIGVNLHRTAYSDVIKHAMDFSTAIFTWDGRLLSQGVFTPGHLGSMPFSLKRILNEHIPLDDWEPGDLVLTNDPNINSGHLPDFFTFEPVFLEDELVGFCATTGHQIDIGGSAPGSLTVRAGSIYEEGLQLPTVKLYDGGDLNEEVLSIIQANSREPRKIEGDVRAHRSASRVGVKRYRELVGEYGFDTVKKYSEELISRTETSVRESLRDIPNGSYSFTDQIDPLDKGKPLRVKVTIIIEDDEMILDWDGTVEQQPNYGINSTITYTAAHSLLAVKSAIDPDSPHNAGGIEPITVTAPEGTLVNANLPVPVGARQVMCTRIVSTVNGALHKAVPSKVPAAGSEVNWLVMMFTDSESGQQQILQDGWYGGAGARPERDGYPAVSGGSDVQNTPIEVIEDGYPLQVNRYELTADTAGDGKYRGGSGSVREYVFTEPATVQLLNERYESGPYGLDGGKSGDVGRCIFDPESGEKQELDSKDGIKVKKNDKLTVYAPGGGGYGKPEERSDDLVQEDLNNGYITINKVQNVYRYESNSE